VARARPSATVGLPPTIADQHGCVFTADSQFHFRLAAIRELKPAWASGSRLVSGLGISNAWPTTLTAVQLTKRWHTLLHLMNFLDDVHERNVLRTVGPVYQFRHARLQDRRATAAANGRNNGRTNQPLG
jgi:hypothetical protein